MPRSRADSRSAAARSTGTASSTGPATLGVDIGALHREVRSHVAWLPGARDFLTRMRAAGKRLLLLTNSHPIALAVKHEETGVLDCLDAAVDVT